MAIFWRLIASVALLAAWLRPELDTHLFVLLAIVAALFEVSARLENLAERK